MSTSLGLENAPMLVKIWSVKEFLVKRMEFLAWALLVCIPIITVLSLFGNQTWLGNLSEQFRLHYVVFSLVAGLSFLLMNQKVASFTILLFGAINLFWIQAYFSPVEYSKGKSDLKILTMNVQAINTNKKGVIEYILSESPDVFAMIESDYGWVEELDKLGDVYPYSLAVDHYNTFSISLYSKHVLSDLETIDVGGVPLVSGVFKVREREVYVMAVHTLPPISPFYAAGNKEQLEEYKRMIDTHPGKEVLVMGDFNQAPWTARMQEFKRETELTESYEQIVFGPTWPTVVPIFLGIKLDYIFHSEGLKTVSSKVGPYLGSDHLPMVSSFQF